jgi:hypothetical protein
MNKRKKKERKSKKKKTYYNTKVKKRVWCWFKDILYKLNGAELSVQKKKSFN